MSTWIRDADLPPGVLRAYKLDGNFDYEAAVWRAEHSAGDLSESMPYSIFYSFDCPEIQPFSEHTFRFALRRKIDYVATILIFASSEHKASFDAYFETINKKFSQ